MLAPLILTTALTGCARAVSITPPGPDPTDAGTCERVGSALPRTLAGQDARDVTPDPGTTAAWGDPPIVLRCGVPAPTGRTSTSLLTTVDGVDWFGEQLSAGARFTTEGRTVRVEVTVPDAYEPATVLGELAPVLTAGDPVVPAG